MLIIHASCVVVKGEAVLLRGPSGAGKSDLALRLTDAGADLVADDRTCLLRQGPDLIASAPPSLAGLIEVRGLGPIELPAARQGRVRLVIDLVAREREPRLPEPRYETLFDLDIPCLALDAFAESAVTKVKLALRRAIAGTLFEPAEARAIALPRLRQA